MSGSVANRFSANSSMAARSLPRNAGSWAVSSRARAISSILDWIWVLMNSAALRPSFSSCLASRNRSLRMARTPKMLSVSAGRKIVRKKMRTSFFCFLRAMRRFSSIRHPDVRAARLIVSPCFGLNVKGV